MKKIGFLSLLVAGAFAACSETDDSANRPAEEQQAQERLITVEVSENPLTDEATGAPVFGTTRAVATTTATLTAFSMNYTGSYKYDFTKTGDTWSTNSWPGVGPTTKIDFYAYTGGTFNYNSGNPYVSFTADENASTQHDLLVATHKEIAYNDASGHVSLSFDHACAAVQFNIGQSQTLKGQSVTYTSIALVGIYNSGIYYYNSTPSPSWSDLSGDATYTMESATSIDIPVSTTTHEGARALSCGNLFMIPQAHSNAKIRIEYKKGGDAKTTADIPLTIDWKAGYLYTINIRLGTSIIK